LEGDLNMTCPLPQPTIRLLCIREEGRLGKTKFRYAVAACAVALLLLPVTPTSLLAQSGTPQARDPGSAVALNPQPLPPKKRVVRRDPTTGRAIIIVSGRKVPKRLKPRPGDPARLNPLLPPKASQNR
jgi:hypothetical protein